MFPKRYGQLATMVLQEVQEMGGPDALDEVFERMATRHAGAISRSLEGLEFDEKLRRVVAWIGRAGTLAEQTETAEGVKVTIHNCPFRNTALKYPQVCTITPHLISQLLGHGRLAGRLHPPPRPLLLICRRSALPTLTSRAGQPRSTPWRRSASASRSTGSWRPPAGRSRDSVSAEPP